MRVTDPPAPVSYRLNQASLRRCQEEVSKLEDEASREAEEKALLKEALERTQLQLNREKRLLRAAKLHKVRTPGAPGAGGPRAPSVPRQATAVSRHLRVQRGASSGVCPGDVGRHGGCAAQPERSAVGAMPEASPASGRKVTAGGIQSLAEDQAKEPPGCARSPAGRVGGRHDALRSLGCTPRRRGEEGQASERAVRCA